VAARGVRRELNRPFAESSAEPTGATRVLSSSTMLEQRIQQQFFDSADLKYAAAELLSKPIADGVSALVGCITAGGKVLSCGNGGSAGDAQHFAAEFVGRFERERPGLAAISLTTDTSILTAVGNDYSFEAIFAKQVEALGAPGDVLLAISTSGNSANVLAAIAAARAKDMTVIAMTGSGGGRIRERLTETDVHICVPHERTARIQEVHLLVLHCLCDAVDLQLLGEQENT
jgi:D-sedoheptulose 7-phosphate isomerase